MPESTLLGPDPDAKKQIITLSLAEFDTLRSHRLQYRLAFGFVILCWMGWTMFANNLTGLRYNILVTAMVVSLGLGFIRLYRVMTTIGYAPWIAAGLCIIQLVPIPGFIFLLMADRRIALAIESAAPPETDTTSLR